MDIANLEEFFRLFVITGNVPDTIDYRNIWEYFVESSTLAGKTFNISNQLLGILQSEICRDPSDNSKPFRLSKAKKNKEWDNYKAVSIKQIPNYISSYVSLTSENYDDSVIAATMMKKEIDTPLEKILVGTDNNL